MCSEVLKRIIMKIKMLLITTIMGIRIVNNTNDKAPLRQDRGDARPWGVDYAWLMVIMMKITMK